VYQHSPNWVEAFAGQKEGFFYPATHHSSSSQPKAHCDTPIKNFMTELQSANSSNMEFQLKLNKPLNPISILNCNAPYFHYQGKNAG
jgi:hypothetical protein